MALHGIMRGILAGALACMLSACWMSEKPLIGAEDAATVPFTGTFVAESDDGTQKLVIGADGDRSYSLGLTNEKALPATRFVDLGGGWYLVQMIAGGEEDGRKGAYLYQQIKYSGGDLYFHSPECKDLPGKFKGLKRDPSQAGGGSKEPTTCEFTRFDGLKAAAKNWVERFEKGQIKSDPEPFRAFSAKP